MIDQLRKISQKDVPGLYIRNGTYQFRRLIPVELRKLAGKREIKVSLKTKNPLEAMDRYLIESDLANKKLAHLKAGYPLSTFNQKAFGYSELSALAKQMGWPYKSHSELEQEPQELEDRLRAWSKDGEPAGPEFQALFGSAEVDLTFRQCIDEYLEVISDQMIGKSEREQKKKLTPIELAFRNFEKFLKKEKALSNPTLKTTTKPMVRAYRQKLIKEVADGQIKGDTANKQLLHVRKVFAKVIENNDWEIANPFSGISIQVNDTIKRTPFSKAFIQNQIMSPNALNGLNPECAAIVLASINTGCGPKELVGLAKTDIFISEDIPYIRIRANQHRQLKTIARERKIPLAGISLKKFQEFPEGFNHYRSMAAGADAVSANVRNYFKQHQLVEGEAKSLYSFRHSFMDRMREASISLDIQDYLMGHSSKRMGDNYGLGIPMKILMEAINKITL